MAPLLITVAFALGLAASRVGLPPLVGFLAAGFVLNAIGAHGGPVLDEIADLGVTLLLFSIGLKLRIRSLLRPEVWACASLHMLITAVVFGAAMYGLSVVGFSLFATLDMRLSLLIAFALSFSSTVFAVKVLEEKGEMLTLHGRVSIGILVMQDLVAVLFLTVSTGKMPSPWALALFGLFLVRPILMAIMDRCHHGELLVLFGVFLALVIGARGFELVAMKADLGALIVGALVAGHPKAPELAKSLLAFKDLFLVGFFLSIGLSGAPSLEALTIAALLVVAVPVKVALFFALLTRFKLRARTALLTSLSLTNYSEFGLIVGAIGVANGWIGNEWLIVISIALSTTFVLASPVNAAAHSLYARFKRVLQPLERPTRLPDDELIDPGEAEIMIFGMGQVGTGAYDAIRRHYGDLAIGVDADAQTLRDHQSAGRKVIQGDATDADFWGRIQPGKIRLVMLAMPNHPENMFALRQLAQSGYSGLVAAMAQYGDQLVALKSAGAHATFNVAAEAGSGFAHHACELLEQQPMR